ncbi:MAG: hypothetical protein CMN30_02585 [Sandaracinus sp.]|nr:hypothetical protein [Sandaracinus sp.]|tara:strand:+ start:267 stop:995 length:729 start_codon:yes stop_codon:yes gene_type:complete
MMLVLALACGDDDAPPPGRALGGGPVSDPVAAAVVPGAVGARAEGAPAGGPGSAGATPEAEEEEEETRDFAAELRTIAGDPRSCGSLGEATGPITIRLLATTTSQGVVTRSSVSGNIPAAVRTCLEARLSRGRFRAPVEEAPRTVSAEIRLEVEEPPSTVVVETTTTTTAPVALVPPPQGTPIHGGEETRAAIMGGAETRAAIMGGTETQEPIEGGEATSTSIMGPSGVAIMGPTGQPIEAD